jgi:hypothetical protein
MTPAVATLLFVTAQRLGELMLARRNTQKLLARGAREAGRSHYPVMVGLHAAWLATLWGLGWNRPVHLPVLALLSVTQMLQVWVIASLGERWTTRIIVLPGAPPCARRALWVAAPSQLLHHHRRNCPAAAGAWADMGGHRVFTSERHDAEGADYVRKPRLGLRRKAA